MGCYQKGLINMSIGLLGISSLLALLQPLEALSLVMIWVFQVSSFHRFMILK